jgi:hypothetical protein
MIAPPCSPRMKNGEPAVCLRAISQMVAVQCAGGDAPDLKPGGWGAICGDCVDELSLLVGNTRAVRAEWEADG